MKQQSEIDRIMKEMGMNEPENLFLITFSKLDYIINELAKYISEDDLSLDYNLLVTTRKILDILQSIHLLSDNERDNTSILSLLRVVVDNYSYLHLLFVETKNKTEREIRLLLFIYDGVATRSQSLEKRSHSFNLQYITQEEANSVELESEKAIASDKIAKKEILCRLSKFTINEELIRKKQWKFKNLNSSNYYSWFDLYKKLPFSEDIQILFTNYLSQFVHGLGISNMQYGKNNEGVSEFAMTCCSLIMNNIIRIVEDNMKSIIDEKNIDYQKNDIFLNQLLFFKQKMRNL